MGYLFSTSNTKPDDPIISTSLTRNDSIPNPSPLESPRESASTSVAKQGTSPEEKKKPKIKDRESQRVMDIQLPEHIKLPPTSLPPLYFNIVLLNKGEAVEKTIKKKMGMKGGIFSKAMSAAANSVISDKAIIDKLSEQLKTNLESTVSEMGIVAIVSKAFQQGN